jgi:serine/threonine protein kinase
MAPEQCAGDPVDARADLYAVGLVLYELITGRGPFDDLRDNVHAIRFAHCRRLPAAASALSPSPLSPALDAVIQRALAKLPADRFQTADEMAAALRRLIEPADPPPASRSRRSRRRRCASASPWIATTVSALAIAFFALGLAFGRTLPSPVAPDRASMGPW